MTNDKDYETEKLEEEYINKMVQFWETRDLEEGLVGGPGTVAAYIAHKLHSKGVDVNALTEHAKAVAIAKGIDPKE